ncbi:MAG TPA: hypothetical protein VGP72_04000 [Planctomycetota bacterium]|jgi:hypothetical protein
MRGNQVRQSPRFALSCAIVCFSLHLIAAEDKPAGPPPGEHKLRITPQNEKEWNCGLADVKAVCYSAAEQMWQYFPERKLPPIEVTAKGGPITLFRRGPNGEIRVKLASGNCLWAQISFQFAHEFTHILCNYAEKFGEVKWLEESICETGSLFALRRMAEKWAVTPPYPNWKSYAGALSSYADERIKKGALPEGKTLAQWYTENAEVLRANATDRDRNQVVACVLLTLLEAHPEDWAAVEMLNSAKLGEKYTLADFLREWRRNCPEKNKRFVTGIAKELGVALGE